MPLKISDFFSFSGGSRKPSQLVISGPVELMNPGTPRAVTVRQLSRKSISEASRKRSDERRRQSSARARHQSNEKPLPDRPFVKGHVTRRSSLPSIYHSRKNSLARSAAITKSHSHGQSGRQGSGTRIQVYQDRSRNDSVIAAMIAEIHLDLEEAEARPVPMSAPLPILTIDPRSLDTGCNNNIVRECPVANGTSFFGDYQINITETEFRVQEDLISPITPLPSPLPPNPTFAAKPRSSDEETSNRQASRQFLGEVEANANIKSTRTPSDWDSRFSWSSMTEISIGIEASDYFQSIDFGQPSFDTHRKLSNAASDEGVTSPNSLFPSLEDERRISMTWKMLWMKSQPTSPSQGNEELSRGSETSSQFSMSSSESSKTDSSTEETVSPQVSMVKGNVSEGAELSEGKSIRRHSSRWLTNAQLASSTRKIGTPGFDTYDIDHIISSYI